MRANSQNTDPNTWTYTASLVLTGRRAHVEVVFADLQRKYGDDLEVVKGPFQHRGSWGCTAALPRAIAAAATGFSGASAGETVWCQGTPAGAQR